MTTTERHIGNRSVLCRYCGAESVWLPVQLRGGAERILLVSTDPDPAGRVVYFQGAWWLRQVRQLEHQDVIDAEAGRPARNRYRIHSEHHCTGAMLQSDESDERTAAGRR